MSITTEQLNSAIVFVLKELQLRGVVIVDDADPRLGDGYVAPIGAEFIQTDEAGLAQLKRFQKFGLASTAWAETLSAGGGLGVTPVPLAASGMASAAWASRCVHITAAATVTLPTATPLSEGFSFIAVIKTNAVVTFVTENASLIRTILGDVAVVGYSYQYAFIAFTYLDGAWYAVGQLTEVP